MGDKAQRSGDDGLFLTVIEPEKLIDYQPSAVVSRTIIKNPGGTVSVFAFDRQQSVSEHTAPFDAIVQVLDGKAEFTIEGRPFTVSAGQTLIMPAGKPHAVSAVERFKMLLTMIRS